MIAALPIAFGYPGVLAALAVLPVLWVLLRVTPPRPRAIRFPPLRLLLDVRTHEETPARTPWPVLLLRTVIAAALIVAMAEPVWRPPPSAASGKGPLLLALDDGWSAAPDWSARMRLVASRLKEAERRGRPAALALLSNGERDLRPINPATIDARLRAVRPQPWLPDRMRALPAIRRFAAAHPGAEILWVADGLTSGRERAFASALSQIPGVGGVRVLVGQKPVLALAGSLNAAASLDVRVLRSRAGAPINGVVRALDAKGRTIGMTPFAMTAAGRLATARFRLPIELRNEIARVVIQGVRSAGAVTLLDRRSQRRRVGVVSGNSADAAEPLLAPDYYINKALAPYADVVDARPGEADPIGALINDQIAVLALADVGRIAGPDDARLAKWVTDGGTLLRFAGTRLAAGSDNFIPVRLRRGGRVLGGALSWSTPKSLAPFSRKSPFYGLKIPSDVKVNRQVLADPDPDLPGKTWATLTDGTPLVTAEKRGKGLIVLFHVTANTTWSNLPLSGLFVAMLRRIVNLSAQPGAPSGASKSRFASPSSAAAPTLTLSGFGALGAPPPTATPAPGNFRGVAGPHHPPGFYGPPDSPLAINALAYADRLAAARYAGLPVESINFSASTASDLRGPLLAIAFLLLLIDALCAIWFGGARRLRTPRASTAALALALVGALACHAARAEAAPASIGAGPHAPQPSARDLSAALKTHLAYVITGDPSVDRESLAGLTSLSRALAARTALVPGRPFGVDPARDELVFYPLLYWPIVAREPQPSPLAVQKIANYMKEGGTILFDTRDALTNGLGAGPSPQRLWLRKLLSGVDVPQLEPTPRDHVITKTFYLLSNFVGRTTTGRTWIQALPPESEARRAHRPVRAGDGVSPIIITSNDLAAGWATTRAGAPLYPLDPGGPRQQEMAIRGGINIVMYALTGNYKADQVHVRDLLQRLAH